MSLFGVFEVVTPMGLPVREPITVMASPLKKTLLAVPFFVLPVMVMFPETLNALPLKYTPPPLFALPEAVLLVIVPPDMVNVPAELTLTPPPPDQSSWIYVLSVMVPPYISKVPPYTYTPPAPPVLMH